MTLADRLAARRWSDAVVAKCGNPACVHEACDLARAILAFVPGEVEAPPPYAVAYSLVGGCVRFGPVDIEPTDAIALGQALVLAGMEATRG